MSVADVLSGRRAWWVEHGDSLTVLAAMPGASIDAVVCDPPYGIGFMGREWDTFKPEAVAARVQRKARKATSVPEGHGRGESAGYVEYDFSRSGAHRYQAWCEAWARECLRVLKPGGHLLAFCGTRMYHRLACGVEDAGFEIRDCIDWIYASGFPKSLDVSKAIEAMARGGDSRDESLRKMRMGDDYQPTGRGRVDYDMPGGNTLDALHFKGNGRDGFPLGAVEVTDPEAQRWRGWGTALKPAHEPIVVARKPLDGSVARNVLKHGTGAINVDGGRVGEDTAGWGAAPAGGQTWNADNCGLTKGGPPRPVAGRWPPNVLLDETMAAELDAQSGHMDGGTRPARRAGLGYGSGAAGTDDGEAVDYDAGGASRCFPVFRYEPKAGATERNAGLSYVRAPDPRAVPRYGAGIGEGHSPDAPVVERNFHPTVKPVALMLWLVRLVTPPGGVVLDPFTGSGTTGVAALRGGWRFVGVEREPEHAQLARARIVGDAPMFNGTADVAAG